MRILFAALALLCATCGPAADFCPSPSTSCGGLCVSLFSDNFNCGGCGQSCEAGQACVMGACGASCPPGSSLCGADCAHLSSDNQHCGACGKVCAASQSCTDGVCADPTCPSTASTRCGGRCVSTTTDVENCGACGTICGPGKKCSPTGCVLTCVPGHTACPAAGPKTYCADTNADRNNCGGCGIVCGAGKICNGTGACVLSCPSGQTACPSPGVPTFCADLQTDPENCSACGAPCMFDQQCIGGMCRSPKRAFVTSTLQTGAMGGLNGADGICQMRANGAGFSGTFRAWLSDSTGSPSTRFTPSAVPYVRVDRAPIAARFSDLTDGTLLTRLDLDELGQAASGEVWSATQANGTLGSGAVHCANWMDGNVLSGSFGSSAAINASWTDSGSGLCGTGRRLYCFEQ